ncbi:MAG: hypothetical protein R3220_09285 [Balneolaceae bacterium]|nr:hypothetical protein [Balneolaceae bacterium]
MSAGYSKTPLVRKLGIKPGNTILTLKAPSHYFDLLGELPPNVTIADEASEEKVPFIHLFAKDAKDLTGYFPIAKNRLEIDGMLWVSWIKKASKLETDISESDVRGLGLELGLVDIKICSVDEDWSGLKFMYRKKDR